MSQAAVAGCKIKGPRATLQFDAPDVGRRDQALVGADSDCWWDWITPGLNYGGICCAPNCQSNDQKTIQMRGKVSVQRGFGDFRPNEDSDYNLIRCPACNSSFPARALIFYKCTARIDFRLMDSTSGMSSVLLETQADNKCEVFGGYRAPLASYTSLIIQVHNVLQPNPVSCLVQEQKLYQRERARMEHVDPAVVLYSQRSISNRFSCGRCLSDAVRGLRYGMCSVYEIPVIQIFSLGIKYHTLNNRRLWVFKKAGLKSIPVKYVSPEAVDMRGVCFGDGGESIKVSTVELSEQGSHNLDDEPKAEQVRVPL